ncbi:YbhB/YbcL family Raf kinase inhibitor-like protein [Cellulomonas sp. McL0617]|uniref:YbhB/YbcL family Raf kinase inhibitor-like protein n=1 Tax=Cellulomonas sp. McL0617 TaxID=3415675 RepID=UPI003CE8626D
MAYEPYTLAFPAAPFTLHSDDFSDGGPLPAAAYAADRGTNASPHLAWDGLPVGTQSLVLTAYDPDAPIPGGLWHWLVKDIPASAAGLPRGAGSGGQALPEHAVQLANDLGVVGYSGVKPPPGTGVHRLVVCATALSVPTLALPPGASAAVVNISLIAHTLGRGLLTGTSRPTQ